MVTDACRLLGFSQSILPQQDSEVEARFLLKVLALSELDLEIHLFQICKMLRLLTHGVTIWTWPKLTNTFQLGLFRKAIITQNNDRIIIILFLIFEGEEHR